MFEKIFDNLPVNLFKEGKTYIADCRPLDIVVSGSSMNKALENFTIAVEMMIEYAKEKGILEEMLLELGWTKTNNQIVPPEYIGTFNSKIPSLA